MRLTVNTFREFLNTFSPQTFFPHKVLPLIFHSHVHVYSLMLSACWASVVFSVHSYIDYTSLHYACICQLLYNEIDKDKWVRKIFLLQVFILYCFVLFGAQFVLFCTEARWTPVYRPRRCHHSSLFAWSCLQDPCR